MKIALTGVLSDVSQSSRSHNYGWALYLMTRIKQIYGEIPTIVKADDPILHNYDVVVVTEGVNFRQGVWNIFGGVSQKLIDRIVNIDDLLSPIVTLQEETIDYGDLCKTRKINHVFTSDIEDIRKDDQSTKLVLGDSHSISVFEPGFKISRNDGKTLHGFLEDYIECYVPDHTEHLRFYAGNIDVRHHLCRIYSRHQLDSATSKLVDRLRSQLSDLKGAKLSIVDVVELLPIEYEDRKIPKTGYYEGKPFHGDWSTRNYAKDLLNDKLEEMCALEGFNFLKWSDDIQDWGSGRKELGRHAMEARQSVHLAPDHYMFKDKIAEACQISL